MYLKNWKNIGQHLNVLKLKLRGVKPEVLDLKFFDKKIGNFFNLKKFIIKFKKKKFLFTLRKFIKII
jgi:hypothetical protein